MLSTLLSELLTYGSVVLNASFDHSNICIILELGSHVKFVSSDFFFLWSFRMLLNFCRKPDMLYRIIVTEVNSLLV